MEARWVMETVRLRVFGDLRAENFDLIGLSMNE